ncbi:MAG: Gfo/Idh/MocA family oxidoreductase [Clostridia bacterium]|nr:Gfo/Idh/MocA family oxidoreductase [Clostridia bacterium]
MAHNVVLVGIGGYGINYTHYFRTLEKEGNTDYVVAGIVDPFWEKSGDADWVRERGFKVYNSLEEFYAEKTADIALIATPIPLHAQQCICAMEHGSNVLVEKPLCPTIDDAIRLQEVSQRTGKFLAVGFQWSFSTTMLSLKKDILAGRFGKPVALRSYISWQRFLSYYNNTWKGKYQGKNGEWILDCVITNATAHYLHNLYFISGGALDEASMPNYVRAESYRVKPDMETPDVFALRGEIACGAERTVVPFFYGCSYSLSGAQCTTFEYEFELATIKFNIDERDDQVRAYFRDGSCAVYGNPQPSWERARKITTCLEALDDPSVLIPCTIKTIMPHLKTCNGLFAYVPNIPVPARYLVTEYDSAGSPGILAHTLRDNMLVCVNEMKLPSEKGYSWSHDPVEFTPDTLTAFPGVYCAEKVSPEV